MKQFTVTLLATLSLAVLVGASLAPPALGRDYSSDRHNGDRYSSDRYGGGRYNGDRHSRDRFIGSDEAVNIVMDRFGGILAATPGFLSAGRGYVYQVKVVPSNDANFMRLVNVDARTGRIVSVTEVPWHHSRYGRGGSSHDRNRHSDNQNRDWNNRDQNRGHSRDYGRSR